MDRPQEIKEQIRKYLEQPTLTGLKQSGNSDDNMSIGGVKHSSGYMVMDDKSGKSPQKDSDEDNYTHIDDHPLLLVKDECYCKVSDESRAICCIPERAKTLKPLWDDEVSFSPVFVMKGNCGEDLDVLLPPLCGPLPRYISMDGKDQVSMKKHSKVSDESRVICCIPERSKTLKPLWNDKVSFSPAFMMKEIPGEDLDVLPPLPCGPLPGYISMDGKDQVSMKKHSYVNEEVSSQQQTDRVDAYATSGGCQ